MIAKYGIDPHKRGTQASNQVKKSMPGDYPADPQCEICLGGGIDYVRKEYPELGYHSVPCICTQRPHEENQV